MLIYGSGTMGLMMLELAKRTGAAGVDVVDINPARLETARTLGVSAAAASADELDRPQGWDLVIDATGNAAAIQDGLGRVAKAGTFLQFGVADYATRVTIDPYRIYNQEITITGSMAVLHSYERAAELFAGGVLDPDVFISDRIPWTATPKPSPASQQARAGKSSWSRNSVPPRTPGLPPRTPLRPERPRPQTPDGLASHLRRHVKERGSGAEPRMISPPAFEERGSGRSPGSGREGRRGRRNRGRAPWAEGRPEWPSGKGTAKRPRSFTGHDSYDPRLEHPLSAPA